MENQPEPARVLNVEFNFQAFTDALIEQSKRDWDNADKDSPMRRTLPWEDIEKSLRAIGDAAQSLGKLNAMAFGTALKHFSDSLKATLTAAVQEHLKKQSKP